MRVLLVSAHPERQSFCATMARTAVERLLELGHRVEHSDLYAMGFDPVAKADDFGSRRDPLYLNYALEQRHNDEAGTLAPDIAAELDKLFAADLLLLVFPIFWFAPPAMLKGWIDRVLVSGRTYGGKRFYDRGGLQGKRAAVALTLGGRPHMLSADGVHGPLEDMLRPLLRGTLAYVGMTVLPPFVAWHVPYVTDAVRRNYLAELRHWLGRLDELPPLSFPSLDAFDDRLFPKG